MAEQLLTIGAILIGYGLGLITFVITKYSPDEMVSTYIDPVTKKIVRVFRSKPKPGLVTRPEQKDILLKENPKLAEETAEMSKAFGDLNVKGEI